MARAADFDLAKALVSPSFTPAQRDAPALVEIVVGGEDPAAQRAAAALAKLGETGRAAVEARLAGQAVSSDTTKLGGAAALEDTRKLAGAAALEDTAELGDAATARLVRVLGLLARGGNADARTALLARAGDGHVRVRRAAITSLGALGGDDARDVLLARWDAGDATPDERRALAEALGRIGGDAVIARLGEKAFGDDRELERRRQRGLLMATRTATRGEESTIDASAALAHAWPVVLRCKAGMAELLTEELRREKILQTKTRDDATVVVELGAKPWTTLYGSRLWSSAAFEVALEQGSEIADRIVRTLSSRDVRTTLAAMTRGSVRYRLGFERGHRRSIIWKVANALNAEGFVNDPVDSTWEITVDEERGVVAIEPKKAVDPRFSWRVADVPAASHPTVAAALALIAGARPTDRVWDPFAGSGAELIERALLGPYRSLTGTDLDERALDAARANVDAARTRAELAALHVTLDRADARTYELPPLDLIITNPPLGSRVQLDAAALLEGVLPRFARMLAPGGRLVWINPAPRRLLPIGEQTGLARTRAFGVDLGGVRGTLERWERSRM